MPRIVFTKTAQRQYQKLPSSAKPRITRAIANLSQNPFAGKKLEGEFKGQYSLRAWPYRIIYEISSKTIVIITIAHRQGAYK